jgi:hypothetical protein
MGASSFARVLTGWTGAIAWSYLSAPYSGTVTPFTRESAASLIARLVHDLLVVAGLSMTASVSTAGIITVDLGPNDDVLELTLTGNVATRTGFTGTYTSGQPYTAATGFDSSWVPSKGMRLVDPLLTTSRLGVTGNGLGGVAPVLTSATTTMLAWDAGIALPELANHEHDLWHDGRVFGRLLVTGVRRTPLSAIRTVDTVQVELAVQEVA